MKHRCVCLIDGYIYRIGDVIDIAPDWESATVITCDRRLDLEGYREDSESVLKKQYWQPMNEVEGE